MRKKDMIVGEFYAVGYEGMPQRAKLLKKGITGHVSSRDGFHRYQSSTASFHIFEYEDGRTDSIHSSRVHRLWEEHVPLQVAREARQEEEHQRRVHRRRLQNNAEEMYSYLKQLHESSSTKFRGQIDLDALKSLIDKVEGND